MTKKQPFNACPEIRVFNLKDIHPAEYNPRIITPEAYRGLSASIMKFGYLEPIIVNIRDGKNTICAGSKRYDVLVESKVKQCTCVVVDLDEADEQALNLTMNNPELQGRFIDALDQYIEDLKTKLPESDFLSLRIDSLQSQLAQTPALEGSEALEDDLNLDPANVTILVGEYRLLISREVYDNWKESIRQEVGFEPTAVISEIKRRLGIHD